jgi:Arc/MetJ-type ribon-helix-helix transcriptional regulator
MSEHHRERVRRPDRRPQLVSGLLPPGPRVGWVEPQVRDVAVLGDQLAGAREVAASHRPSVHELVVRYLRHVLNVSRVCSARLMSAVSAPPYGPDMSDRKTRLTVTVDPRLAAYAEQLVEAGKAPSVSALFNDALAERLERDRRMRRRWKEAAEHADRAKVDRMKAHIDAQLAQLDT